MADYINPRAEPAARDRRETLNLKLEGLACTILDHAPALFEYGLLALSLLFIAGYLGVAFIRLRYPFELEWMEGSMVDEARRLLLGQKLYVSPSIDYVPYLYTPLYFYLSALVAGVTGIGFLPLRLVSIVASLGCLVFIGLIVYRETRRWFPALLAAGLFVATYRASGLWFDIARIDSLYLCLLLAAMFVVKFHQGRAGAVLAGLLIAAAFLAKQTSFAMAAPVMLYCLLVSWRRGLLLIGAAVAGVGLSTLALNWANDGWYAYYIFGIASSHPLVPEIVLTFWQQDILMVAPVAGLLGLSYFASLDRRRIVVDGLFYLALGLGFVGGAWAGRLNFGGYNNVLMPAYAAIALLCGLAVHQGAALLRRSRGRRPKAFQLLLYTACLCQFGMLYFDPRLALPTAKDLETGRQFMAALAALPGDVYVPFHGYLPAMAGKTSHAHAMAARDLIDLGPDGPVKTRLIQDFEQALRDRRFAAVVMDQDLWSAWLPGDVRDTYEEKGPILKDPEHFYPITGFATRPRDLFLPKD